MLLKVNNKMVKKGILNQLLQTHDLASIEQHLVYCYLKNKGIDLGSNLILMDYFNGFNELPQLLSSITSLNIASIKELEKHLELMIPVSDRKLNGAFFTPDYIVDFIVNEIAPKESETNLDPSCGCGAFLVGLVDYYKKKFNKPIRKIIKENIFGSDILAYNIHRAKLILTIYALQNGEQVYENDFNLYHQDSLRVHWKQKFDNVVGNPPYVKFQDLTDENRDFLVRNCQTVNNGTFNLYFAFFELGYKLLKSGGKLGFITPNNYFTSMAGESLRRFFHQQKCIRRIIDFNHIKVFDARTYTAITFLNKQQNDAIFYDRINEDYNPEFFLAKVNGSPNYWENLNVKKWRLLKKDEQENIRIIENIGTSIGKLFNISVGIATLRDNVFFVDGSDRKNDYYLKVTPNGCFEIEKDVLKSVYKISDFKTQHEVFANSRKIIFPYKIINDAATPIPENEFKSKFPKCYEYLLSEKQSLLNRDKGKVKYEPFYIWGRTQGLTKTGKKILTPTFSQHPRFLLVDEHESFFTNGYGIFFKEEKTTGLFDEQISLISRVENIDVVQKILNSFIMEYYVGRTSVSIAGGYPCYQKNFIEKFSIPALTSLQIETIRNLKDKKEIDQFLIGIYHLNLPDPNLLSYIESKSLIKSV